MGYRTSVFEQHPDWCIPVATVVLHRGNGAEVLAPDEGASRQAQGKAAPLNGQRRQHLKRPAGALQAS